MLSIVFGFSMLSDAERIVDGVLKDNVFATIRSKNPGVRRLVPFAGSQGKKRHPISFGCL